MKIILTDEVLKQFNLDIKIEHEVIRTEIIRDDLFYVILDKNGKEFSVIDMLAKEVCEKVGSFMNLAELKNAIDFRIENLRGVDLKDIPVLITLSEGSVGARTSIGVRSVGMGIDWENGQFRIEPSKALVNKGNSLEDVKTVIQKEFNGRKYYACPGCHQKINKDDYFCRYCSQKLR